ncbi:MAG TPA: MFS transporter [Solirubrobacteraceae bacterium]|nr:MFS transporter [Solirubrobacteraceae bacterium]
MPAIAPGAYRGLLRRPGYPSFVLTVSLSRVAGSMFNTAGVLLVLQRTHSGALAGLTAAATVIPGVLSGPLLGAWIDVARRRRTLIVTDQLLSVVALAAILLLAGHAPGWTVPAVATLYSVTRPLSSGSFTSGLAELAGMELLDAASAIEATSLNLAVVIGPVLAAILSGVVGPGPTVEVQMGLTLAVAALIAGNAAFEARPPQRAESLRGAVRAGVLALTRQPVLRTITLSSVLAAFGWGLMFVGFPRYAVAYLHAPAHASGYLWAAVAGGSIVGTFAFRGGASLARSGASYLALGLSALLWLLAGSLAAGVALITVTGVLEGPAYSGSVTLRQRSAPPEVRGQVLTTFTSLTGLAISAGAAVGGLVASSRSLVLILVVINILAAALCISRRSAAAEGGLHRTDRGTQNVHLMDRGTQDVHLMDRGTRPLNPDEPA